MTVAHVNWQYKTQNETGKSGEWIVTCSFDAGQIKYRRKDLYVQDGRITATLYITGLVCGGGGYRFPPTFHLVLFYFCFPSLLAVEGKKNQVCRSFDPMARAPRSAEGAPVRLRCFSPRNVSSIRARIFFPLQHTHTRGGLLFCLDPLFFFLSNNSCL